MRVDLKLRGFTLTLFLTAAVEAGARDFAARFPKRDASLRVRLSADLLGTATWLWLTFAAVVVGLLASAAAHRPAVTHRSMSANAISIHPWSLS
jgi:hypothetical protein